MRDTDCPMPAGMDRWGGFRALGLCLDPLIVNGDIMLVDFERELRDRDLAAFILRNDEGQLEHTHTVKRFVLIDGKPHLDCNTGCVPLFADMVDEVEFLGVVVGTTRVITPVTDAERQAFERQTPELAEQWGHERDLRHLSPRERLERVQHLIDPAREYASLPLRRSAMAQEFLESILIGGA